MAKYNLFNRFSSWGKPRPRPPLSPWADNVVVQAYREGHRHGRSERRWHWTIRLTYAILWLVGLLTLITEIWRFAQIITGG